MQHRGVLNEYYSIKDTCSSIHSPTGVCTVGYILPVMSSTATIVAPRSRQRSYSASFLVDNPSHSRSSSTSTTSSTSSYIPLQPLRKRRASLDIDRILSNSPLRSQDDSAGHLPKRRNLTRRVRRRGRKMPFLEAHYHPLLFALMMLCGMAELGLTAFLISAGNEHRTWPRPKYYSL